MFKFNKDLAIGKELQPSGHHVYIFKCADCDNVLRVRHFKRVTDKCTVCSQRMEPFNKSYKSLVNTAKKKNLPIDITFNDFLMFVEIKRCHYCYDLIEWKSFNSGKYFLDRKENDGGYTNKSCVVCCSRCNYGKSNAFLYKEWYKMTGTFRAKVLSDSNND